MWIFSWNTITRRGLVDFLFFPQLKIAFLKMGSVSYWCFEKYYLAKVMFYLHFSTLGLFVGLIMFCAFKDEA